jgi:glycosyltransferase involved in cell wall biosynthesis
METPKPDFVIVGYRDWCYAEDQGINVRDLHFAVEFANSGKAGKVLFINRPVTLLEQIFRLKRWKLRTGELVDSGFGYRLYRIPSAGELYVLCTWVPDLISPLVLGRSWWNRAFRKGRIKRIVADAKRRLGIGDGILALCTPFATSAIDAIGHGFLIFDVIDNFAKHLRMRAAERRFCAAAYREIEKRADLITCVSAESTKVFPAAKRLLLVRNGVDRGWMRLIPPKPPEYASMRGKIVGFGGNITKKFACGFLVSLARSLPDVNFVLIGHILDAGILAGFDGIRNIHYLGFRDFAALPAYYYHLDAGMILYQAEKAHDGDPLKLYEYLSLGTPVITLPAKWLQNRFDGVLFVADSPDAFKASLETIAARGREEWRGKCRMTLLEEDFWDKKAEAIIDNVIKEPAG